MFFSPRVSSNGAVTDFDGHNVKLTQHPLFPPHSVSSSVFSSMKRSDLKSKSGGVFIFLFNPPPPAVLFLLFEWSHQVCFSISRVLHTQGWRYTKCSDLSDADSRMSFSSPAKMSSSWDFLSLSFRCLLSQAALTGCRDPRAFGLRLNTCFCWRTFWPPLLRKKPLF